VVQLVVVDRSGRMGPVLGLDLVVEHGTVDPYAQAVEVDVVVVLRVSVVVDRAVRVYRPSRPILHRYGQAVDLRA
jgi:hypothetical protein